MPDRGSGRPHGPNGPRGPAGPGRPRFGVGRPGRGAKTLLITAAILAGLAILFAMFAGFWTDWLWYRSVGYTSVYRTELLTRTIMFAVFGVVMALAVGFNIWLAHRLRPPLSAMSMEQQNLDRYRMSIAPYKRWILLGVSLLIGLIAGGSASAQWRTWLQFVNGTSFGEVDPQFHKDVSFYAFDYPFYRFLLGFGFAVVVLSIIGAALTHYLYGGLRITTPGSRITQAATGHLSVLLGLFVALKAVAYWLDRYGLALKSGEFREAGWTGLRYVDANAYLPAKTILTIIAAICALLFFATLWRRGWQLPVLGLGLMVLSAVLIGGVYPALVQQFQVRPNEQARESEYIERHMQATKDAYDIADAQIDDYPGTTDADPETLRNSVAQTASIRLLDPNVVSPAYQQIQQVRGYYQFPSTLDVDRYPTADGEEQDTVIGLREMNVNSVPESNWINDHFRYTHGFGMVAASGTELQSNGEPRFTEQDLPPEGQISELGEYEPRIYFGEYTTQYSIVGGPQREIDYAGEDGEVEYSYQVDGAGVSLDNYFNRAAYALTMGEPQILYSGAIGEGSQILYNRTPKERVQAVAPWLTIDGDPYPAVVDGQILWIVDAYTTTNGYPYSSRTTLGDATETSLTEEQGEVIAQQNQVNYIRNSVKATVNAYTGEVILYEWDENDPVLQTWMKAFPGTVQDRSEISDALMDHLRYPQDLFNVQRELLQRYHVDNPGQFYSGSERWQVPDDPTTDDGTSVPPYYLSMAMPDQDEPVFSLTTTFTPLNRETLSAYMAVEADARSPDYGTIRVLTLPSNTTVWGPQQVQSRFNSDTEVANQINIWQRGDSQVRYGNLLTVPLQGGLLYVQPVYVLGAGQNYPLMQRVLVAYGEEIAFEPTLDQALDVVFGVEGAEETPPEGEEGDGGEGQEEQPPPDADATLEETIQEAQDAYADAQEAYADGDWEAYADAQQRLQEALERLGELPAGRQEEEPEASQS
ncbi:UPF0182 family protein [Streptomyces sp. 7-21]|jgi:uncharacterized membrane protein (UPF0182 family)|uniref:UPF0182 family membrane protein n=1 Tax=Streptomyces sp. 7-21 TaxID=2802283 RepID=UPI00191E84FD|nr:UPF0182 family protein [Streptomyces sp. 7-21]MBL1066340.1 UPF0182 family protein [Streptomyces sp. 7-21]